MKNIIRSAALVAAFFVPALASAQTFTKTNSVSVTSLPALPAGANVIGGVTQSGTWNVNNISGTVSLPTGAATSANQATANTTLGTISTNTTVSKGSGITDSTTVRFAPATDASISVSNGISGGNAGDTTPAAGSVVFINGCPTCTPVVARTANANSVASATIATSRALAANQNVGGLLTVTLAPSAAAKSATLRTLHLGCGDATVSCTALNSASFYAIVFNATPGASCTDGSAFTPAQADTAKIVTALPVQLGNPAGTGLGYQFGDWWGSVPLVNADGTAANTFYVCLQNSTSTATIAANTVFRLSAAAGQ